METTSDEHVDLDYEVDEPPAWHRIPMFRGIPFEALSRLEEMMKPVEFDKGTVILRQGDSGEDMFVLVRGKVRVEAESQMHDTLFERLLSGPAVFGEMALVTKEARTASVTAESHVECLCGSRGAIETLIEYYPKAAQILGAIVGSRLLEAETLGRVGKYRITGRLGRGAMATVFEAVQPNLDRPVALKMLSHALANSPGFIEHFKKEARRVARFDHPNIVRVHDTVAGFGTHFIVMERLTGNTLDELIKNGVRLEPSQVRRVLVDICRALAYSHDQGLLHRDVKPSNVFMHADGSAKLLDFGIAVEAERSATGGRRPAGTPYFMSPEQILGRQLDGRTDLYSVGILAYQLLTLRVPFDATTAEHLWQLHLKAPMKDPRDIYPDIPDDLGEFVLRAAQKRRQDRFVNCAEGAAYLALAGELPMVHKLSLATMSIAYHPSRRAHVAEALNTLRESLATVSGVSVHESVQAPRTEEP